MDSLVKPRPNHYELLGLTPSATDAEIARAFAREISPLTPHAFGDIALLSVAHETLRDPARRLAYDESLGLNAKPKAPPPLQGWQYRTTVRVAGPPRPAPARATTEPPAPVEQAPTPQPPPPAAAEPRREWIPPRPVPLQHFRPLEDEPAEWKRPVIIGGGIFLGVGLLGVLAGLWAARDVQSKIPAEAVALESAAEARPVSPEPAVAKPVSAAVKPSRSAPPAARARDRAPPPQPVQVQEEHAEDVPEIPSEQVAALTSEANEAPASMPLSNAVVARTIRRIGYACGEVASTSAVEGAPGAFKVTCTSGQSYRAAPVRGRYHFRKWDG